MTQAEFVDKYKHPLGGIMLDALTPRDGAHKSLFVATIMEKVERLLKSAYADARHPTELK